jgi:hypothetical protein
VGQAARVGRRISIDDLRVMLSRWLPEAEPVSSP